MNSQYKIELLNLQTTSDDEYFALNKIINTVRYERQPDDPPIPLEETTNQLKNLPFVDLKMCCVWNEDFQK